MFSHLKNNHGFVLPVFCILLMLVVTGCAGREKPVLSLAAKQSMNTSKLVIANNYPELEADIQGSNATAAMGGGLLFLALDIAAMTHQKVVQNNLIEPVIAYAPKPNMLTALKAEINQAVIPSTKFQYDGQEIDHSDIESVLSKHSKEFDSVGVLIPKFRFSEDLSTLNTSLQVKFYPISSTLKAALKVSEGFNQPFIDTLVHEAVSPNGMKHALVNDLALKKEIESKIRKTSPLLSEKEIMEMTKSEIERVRTDAKNNNVMIWSQNNGQLVKEAISSSNAAVAEKLNKLLPTLFPNKV